MLLLGTTSGTHERCFEYAPYMTSTDMNRLAGLYGEIEMRLERGEASNPELERLFDEVSKLIQTGEDVWFNFDPKGMSQLVRLSPEIAPLDTPGSPSVWR